MLPIPENVLLQFNEVLKQRAVVESLQVHYRKWLRYFLVFSRKYSHPEAKSEQIRLFTEKLKSKKQTPQQCTQAAHAVSLFFESQKLQNGHRTASPPPTRPANQQPWAHNTRGRKFQSYLHDKPPDELSSIEVKEYLTYLAVQCHVASSTQNQAFNALLFLFRHVLKKDFGDQRDVPRAKKSKYIPVVLSRQEIDVILKHLEYPFDLVVNLLYGCGLRLFECLGLRVQNFNLLPRSSFGNGFFRKRN